MKRRMQTASLAQAVACFAALSALAGCSTADRTVVSSIPTDDYRVRHPIVLAEAPQTLDIFPSGGAPGLDRHSADQVRQFAQVYRSQGAGPITVLVPTGTPAAVSRGAVEDLRHALAAGGANGPVAVSTYPATDPRLAAPVRLSFTSLKAKVADPCGDWPRDLASGSSLDGWENKPYWNFGCSYQTAIAAQVADPRDLAAPRAEAPSDTMMRSRAIESIRKGIDPGTDWKTKNTSISSVGGN